MTLGLIRLQRCGDLAQLQMVSILLLVCTKLYNDMGTDFTIRWPSEAVRTSRSGDFARSTTYIKFTWILSPSGWEVRSAKSQAAVQCCHLLEAAGRRTCTFSQCH